MPVTFTVPSPILSILAPIAESESIVAHTSSEKARLDIMLSPSASAAQISARWEMLFDGGAVTHPSSREGESLTL
jgi:hypothetical protein